MRGRGPAWLRQRDGDFRGRGIQCNEPNQGQAPLGKGNTHHQQDENVLALVPVHKSAQPAENKVPERHTGF